jgi:hypothetical protein
MRSRPHRHGPEIIRQERTFLAFPQEHAMANLFISYAKPEEEVARRLEKRLVRKAT